LRHLKSKVNSYYYDNLYVFVYIYLYWYCALTLL
jgi:hypothetical protein